ncbi:MAG: SPOR domain-containing protein [Kiloniellales bacterium]
MADDPRSLARGPRPLPPPPASPEVESRYGIHHPEPDLRHLRRHRHRRYLPMTLALLVLLLFCGLLWYSYTWSVGEVPTASLPVIEPEPGAEKMRPESPGGLEVPYQDKLVLNQITPNPGEPQVERLLPPPEDPQALAVEPIAPAADAPAPAAPASSAPAPDTDTATAGQTATAPPPPEAAISEAPPSAPEPSAPAPKATPEVSAALSQALNEPPPQASADAVETAAPPVSAQATPEAPASAPQAAAARGGVLVQFASLKSEDNAKIAWERLKDTHPSELAALSLTIERADLGERGVFYRVQGGPFADRAAAEELCAALKAKQQDCLVVIR